VAVGLAAAALPWLNVRYAPLAVLVVAHALWRHPRARVALAALAPALVSAAGLLLYHQALYGFWDPRRVYGRRREFALSTLAEGFPGLLLDQEFGLLVYAPVLALALPGFAFLWRRDRRLAIVAVAAVGVVLLTAGTWPMWRGGFNPPARFLVPIAPLLALAVAMAWDRRGLTAGAAASAGRCGPSLAGLDRSSFTAIATGRPPCSGSSPGPGSGPPSCRPTCWPTPTATGSVPSGRWRSWPPCLGAPGW
jgi:hypothetical protein